MKVWHDWDSGPYETLSEKEPTYGSHICSEITEAEWEEWTEVLTRYDTWQTRLKNMREARIAVWRKG